MKNGDKLYFALNMLIDISEDMQKQLSDGPFGLDVKHFTKEFCTIKLETARRTGHTYAIIKLLKERFSRAIVISPNYIMSKALIEAYSSQTSKTESEQHKFFTSQDPLNLHGRNAEAIIIDNASWVKDEDLEQIYNMAESIKGDNKYFYVVLVH